MMNHLASPPRHSASSAVNDSRSRPRRNRSHTLRGLLLAALVALSACRDEASARFVALDTTDVPRFDGAAAHELLRRQVAFGPRVPGTAAHAAQLEWMSAFLRERADTVEVTRFTHDARDGSTLPLANVFARFRPAERDRVLLLAHWDTRPTADMDLDEPDTPIDGANDGASGVAVLLQLADVLSSHSSPIGVDILLVDGEDYGPGEPDMYLGAKHFAANQPPGYQPLYGILLDMVGDRDPVFPIEGNSRDMAPEVVERVWRVAEQIGLGHVFVRRSGGHITDDHIPLNRAGIRTINIIDFDYGPGNAFWHTHRDVVENTGPDGLEAVGRVLLTLLWNGG
jgi:glutaminyl-peptide cyclotransferase